MATLLTKPVTRRIVIDGLARPLNITLTLHGVEFREYKRKISFLYPYPVAFLNAVQITIDANRRDREKKRRKVTRGHKVRRRSQKLARS
jgi:hypothetical protein